MLATQADSLSSVPLHEVLTFYSYKGGTGRTMALANIACLFARQGTAGMRVLVIDWDLEAPGLHYYLRPPNGTEVDLNSAGVVEYFSRALELVDGATRGDDDAEAYAQQILGQIPFKEFCRATAVTNLDLMPAGRLDSTYQGRLAKINWQQLYEEAPAIFRSFARQVTREYDVVLVDSRTGMTDISGICTALLPDKLVVVFTPNQQSLAGVEQLVLNSVQYRQGSRDIRSLMVYPLPSRIDAERDKLRQLWRHGDRDRGVEGFQPQFERILCAAYALQSCELSSYFDEVQIQHSPDYSYGEAVATRDAPDADRFSIVRSYQALLQWLQSSAEPWESPESATQKKRLDLLLQQETDVLREGPPTELRGLIELQEEIVRLAISQRGPHHLDTVSAVERLIRGCLHQMTDLPRAMELFDQLFQGFSQMRGPARLKALGVILNGASALRSEGRTQDADHLVQSIVAFAGQNSAEFDESTVDFIERLADNLCHKHALVEAHTLLEFIVQRRCQLLGADRPETLRSMDKLAETLREQRDLTGARKLQEQVLEGRRRVLGEEHPDTLRTMNSLAETLHDQRDLAGARRLQEQVLEVRRRALGEEHPDTLASMNNLAYTLSAEGDLAGARRLLEQILEIRGEESPDTLKAMDTLAYTLSAKGDLAGARGLQEQVLEARRRVLGEEHPDTLRTMNSLAETLHAQRDLVGARRLLEQALDTSRRVLGEKHPDTLTSMNNLAYTLSAEGDVAGARRLQEKLLTMGRHIAGSVAVGSPHSIGRDFVPVVNTVVQVGEDPEKAKSVIALYLYALATDLAGLKLGEIDTSADQTRQTPLHLADIYVPLDTTTRIPTDVTLAQWLSRELDHQRDDMKGQREVRPVSALEALAAHRELTVLGKPGSGKSTFGASVLLALARAWQGHGDQMARLGETWAHGALLPIRVILRRFAEQLSPGDKAPRAGDVWAFIGRDLDASGYGLSTDAMKYVQRIARTQGALILLDGLDECGNSASRERVREAVHELMRSAGPMCRFVLTERPYASPGGPDPAGGVYALADLDDAQIEQFIRGWNAALVERKWHSPGEAERKLGDLLGAGHRPNLLPLARNPLLLTLMATLHTNRGRLPDDRADLYNEAVDLLMLRWNRQIGADKALLDELAIPGLKLSDLREVLEEMAFKVHEENVGREGTADIGEHRLTRAFRPLLKDSKDKADVVVDYIEKRAGLLIGQGEKDGERQFTFPHRTFQEFLAACHLAAQDDFPAKCAQLARTAPAHWQHWEIVLPLAARLAKADRGASAADELIADFRARLRPDATDWACALLAGMQLLEIGLGAVNKRERTHAIAARVADWLAASLPVHPDDGGLPVQQRAQAGDVLAALGDRRFDPECFYLPADELLGFVRIPADSEFRIGTRKADAQRVATIIGVADVPDNEINDALTPTPEFYIACYPVTVAQFRAFVDDKGFEIGDADALRDPDSRPVRLVSWHEARAYCDWLNNMLATVPALEGIAVARLVREGRWRIALPSELEWEKAARGGLPNAVYSWDGTRDPNRANYGDSGIGDTSAVGCFAANGFDLHDMIGNVWEWTRSLWVAYPYKPDDPNREDLDTGNDKSRVVRGGSWNVNRVFARCACRYSDPPDGRSDNLGFRVVLRSAPVPSL